MTDIEQQIKLSKRDKIRLVISSLSEIDDRLVPLKQYSKVNFSGTLSESKNQAYLEHLSQEFLDWSEERLLEFATSVIADF